ncbi:hypothetical protein DPV78_011613 [Talaromyces pinophilus]|nr:hypothetical protein DPV78_011613 [Talaromyces pinophilus]
MEEADNENASPRQQKTTTFMVLFSFYIALSGWIYNFDLTFGGFVLIVESYIRDFGTCVTRPDAAGVVTQHCTLSALQQSLISLTYIFVGVGAALAGVTGNYLGRRGTIQVGCLIVAIGAGGMLGSAGNYPAYIACKCIGGVGLGHFIAAAPTYGVESTAANKRGILTSLFNVGLGTGACVGVAVCWSTSNYPNSLAWQIPIICQLPLSLILGVGVMMFPESPRWLLLKGKEGAARKSFARFSNLDPDSPEVTLQIQEVQHYIELEKATGKATSWTDIFCGTDRRRMLTALLVVIGQAISGGKFISTYLSVFFSGVGIGNTFLILLIGTLCALAGGIMAPWILEYGGRRFSLLVGYTTMGLTMLIISAVATGLGPTSHTAKKVLVVLLCFWQVFYGAFVVPGVAVTAPEMHSIRLRTYGTAFVAMCYEIFSFAAAFYTPYMLNAQYGNMGLNVGYFYFGISAIILVLVFFFVPETARLTLEQIDDHFLSKQKAWKTSTTHNKRIAKGLVLGNTSKMDNPDKIDNL